MMDMVGDLAPFWLSIRVASMASALIVLLGLPTAWVLARRDFPGKGLVAGLLVLPLVLPPTVPGFRDAPDPRSSRMAGAMARSHLGDLPGLPLGRARWWPRRSRRSRCSCSPALGAFEGVNPGLEDAARLLGRGEASVFVRVTVPLSWRGLAAGAVLAFARSIGDFGATLMVAGDTPGTNPDGLDGNLRRRECRATPPGPPPSQL